MPFLFKVIHDVLSFFAVYIRIAERFYTDIAVDWHGCCVLQKCITFTAGGLQEKLVAEICVNDVFLAQDAFG